MNIRLFPDGSAYVETVISVDQIMGEEYVLPIDKDLVDISSIRLPVGIQWKLSNISVVEKDGEVHLGSLLDISDAKVSINQGLNTLVVRNYDTVNTEHLLVLSGNLPRSIPISYITRGIEANVIHNLYLDTNRLITKVDISNKTSIDITNGQFEIITGEQVNAPKAAYSAARTVAMYEDTSSSYSSSIGNSFQLPGSWNINSGYGISIPLVDIRDLDIDISYTIDAPNGKNNAIYTIQWISPIALPNGVLYVYSNNKINSISSLPSIGKDEPVTVESLSVSTVYAVGTVSDTWNSDTNIRTVELKGYITNTLQTSIIADLRYPIGTSEVLSNEGDISDGYIHFYTDIGKQAIYRYSHTIILQN